MRLAVVVPLLDRAASIEDGLRALQPLRRRGHRVIVADGGSRDDGLVRARPWVDRVLLAPRGWALQADAGARAAEAEDADALLFLPANLRLPRDADRAIARALDNAPSPWGFFDLDLDPPGAAAPPRLPLRLAAALCNAGARATGIGLAEQGLFIRRSAYIALQGFAHDDEPGGLPRDVAFCRRALLLGAPIRLRDAAHLPAPPAAPRALLGEALRRECWRLACALQLPWPRREPPRWALL